MKTVLASVMIFLSLSSNCWAFRQYDSLVFALEWPASFCKNTTSPCDPTRKVKLPKVFTLDGLWPQMNGKEIKYCKEVDEFDVTKLKDFRKTLDYFWPDLTSPPDDNQGMWKKQWQMHGSCTGGDFGFYEYFYIVQRQLPEYNDNLTKVFRNAGIKPGKSYRASRIADAITDALPTEMQMVCRLDEKKSDEDPYLYQILVHVNPAIQFTSPSVSYVGCNETTTVSIPRP